MRAQQGRARIEKQKQIELANIQKKLNESLTILNQKYETLDKAKSAFGWIGIVCLSSLFGSILVNDLLKLLTRLYYKLRRYLRERRAARLEARREAEERENELIAVQVDEKYAQDLDEGLERVYNALVRARIGHIRREVEIELD